MASQARTQTSFCFAGEHRQFQVLSQRFFGRPLRKPELRGLSGAPRCAELDVGVLEEEIYIEYHEIQQVGMSGVCRVGMEPSGRVLWNDSILIFRKEFRALGLGLACFARQVFWSRKLGILWARTVGGRKYDQNGYYSWPRYGFDALLPSALKPQCSEGFGTIMSVLDLMATKKGRQYWRENGSELTLAFDFSPQSRSMRVLNEYILEVRLRDEKQ